MRSDDLCGLLAEGDRLRVFAAVVLGAGTPDEVAGATGLTNRQVERALSRLVRGGAIARGSGRLVADPGVFKHAVRAGRPATGTEPMDSDPRRDAVLRAFIKDGRLVRIPAPRGKRGIVLEHIAAVFEPGIRYPERAVDAMVRAWHTDHAALRRYLVDEGLLARDNGVYWRIGGRVDIPPVEDPGGATADPAN